MAPDTVAKLNASEVKKNISKIAGLSKVYGRIHDDRAKRDACYNKYHKQIFRDLLLDNLRLLQYYQQLDCNDRTACALQRSALQTLYEIYSFELRPADKSKARSLETLLQRELIKIINRPYGIQGKGGSATDATKLEESNSPLWELSNLSLKLTRILIDRGLLLGETSEVVETHLTNLVETLHFYQMNGQSCPGSSYNFSLLAHCLSKLLTLNGDKEREQRKLLSSKFICHHLFPLACEFAIEEYPAAIVDPIDHYELFEICGRPENIDETVVDWIDDSGNLSRHLTFNRSGSQGGLNDANSDNYNVDLLPPAHVCLAHLIYKLICSSSEDQAFLVGFLQRKILDQKANSVDKIDVRATGDESEASKLTIMSQIMALQVLGRVKILLNSADMFSFLRVLVVPNLERDCLLVKICKYQLLRLLVNGDLSFDLHFKVAQIFLTNFLEINDMEDFDDHKLFLILTGVASIFLCALGPLMPLSFYFNPLLANLLPKERELQLRMTTKIVTLYLDHKIIAPLCLVEKFLDMNIKDDSFIVECDRCLDKAIDLIASQLLEYMLNEKDPASQFEHLLQRLFSFVRYRKLPLPDKTVDRLLILAQTCLLDNFYSRPLPDWEQRTWDLWNWGYLMRALNFPLREQTKASALNILDQLLDFFITEGTNQDSKLVAATIILGNIGYYHAMNQCISNSGTATKSDRRDKYDERNLLFKSPHRISKIFDLFKKINQRTHLSSSWIMSTLMSWPSSSVAVRPEQVSVDRGLDQMWQPFVELTLIRFDKFESLNGFDGDGVPISKTRDNLLFALMATFNREPKRLESHLNALKGTASENEPHIERYLKLWLEVVNKADFVSKQEGVRNETFRARCHALISYETLVYIHQARAEGKLAFSIKRLASQLNSARQKILKWLTLCSKEAILCSSPLIDFYADSVKQVNVIGKFE